MIKGSNPLGEVTGGQLHFEGLAIPAVLVVSSYFTLAIKPESGKEMLIEGVQRDGMTSTVSIGTGLYLDCPPEAGVAQVLKDERPVVCMLIGRVESCEGSRRQYYVMLLEKVDQVEGNFRRIGMVTIEIGKKDGADIFITEGRLTRVTVV
jgi:hypothetical protein